MRAFLEDLLRVVRDPRFTDPRVDPIALMAIAVIVVVFSTALWIHVRNSTDLLRGKADVAIGSGKGVTHHDDAPPIPPPTEIISLRIYPVKSCRGLEISSTRLRKSGLSLDRNWMFIDAAKREFLTIRSDPSMTLIDTALRDQPSGNGSGSEQMLEISIHNTDHRVLIPAFPSRSWLESHTSLASADIWGEQTDVWEYPAETNQIFSDFFSKPVALVYKGPSPRLLGVNGRPELYGQEVAHHFADVMSLQVASASSLADLNRRLGTATGTGTGTGAAAAADDLTIERFRPNIIVRGRPDMPWEEDTWKRIRISTQTTSPLTGDPQLHRLDLDVVARCARCQVPNVNPSTADKHPRQPWDELMRFRRVDAGGPAKYKPCFGMLCVPRAEGVLRVGAQVECLETTAKHLYNTRGFADL